MRPPSLVVILCCFAGFLPAFEFQVPGYGNLKSIGKTPYPPSSFYPTEVLGVNGGYDSRWPNGIIPYTFDYKSSDPANGITLTPALVAKQMALLQGLMKATCLKFVPRTKETNYITYRFSTGCNSYLGPIGGQQFVNLAPWCFPDLHETMHALGFDHEELRRDRDYYMAFNWTNIPKGIWERNNLPTFGTPLDPKCLMRTGEWAGKIDPKYPAFILPDGSDASSYENVKWFNEGDRQKINRAYNCIANDTCWDEDPFNCPIWASQPNACKDPNWVPNLCPKKCCYDYTYCANDKLHCDPGSDYTNYCNETCGFCKGKKDNRNDCQYIGATLGCNTDPKARGMAKYYRKSCKLCTRPAVVNIPPMILTKCQKTCNMYCNTVTGCNPLATPLPNLWTDIECNVNWFKKDLANWCKNDNNAIEYCQTACFKVGVKKPCPALCVDLDPVRCPQLAATKGCFSQFS